MTTPTSPAGGLDVLERPAPVTSHGGNDGDHDLFAHYVKKQKIVDASVFGNVLTALCGKKFVPTRSPEGRTVCPECKYLFENVVRDDSGDTPPAE